MPVAVDVADRDTHAAGEGRREGEEAVLRPAGAAVEHLDVRPAAGARAGDEVGVAIAGHVAGRHEHAAGEPRIRLEGEQYREIGGAQTVTSDPKLLAPMTIREAVGVEVARRDMDATVESAS